MRAGKPEGVRGKEHGRGEEREDYRGEGREGRLLG